MNQRGAEYDDRQQCGLAGAPISSQRAVAETSRRESRGEIPVLVMGGVL
jgi:hypothetical protein